MSGLFVHKHVEALRAQGIDVRVIHSTGWLELWRKWLRYRWRWELPDLVVLNVIQKQGLLALRLKKRYHIPYIIIEHWSGYLAESGMYMRQSHHKRQLLERIARHAACILTVSDTLREAMQRCGIRNRRWERIDNVVDDFFFEGADSIRHNPNPSDSIRKKTFLHVSCFDERAKNVSVLLRAAKLLHAERQDWRLALVGNGPDYQAMRKLAKELQIPEEQISWTGELPPCEVSRRMQEADALVLTSRYETCGVVLAEAAAVGIPIVSTAVGIAPELITSDSGVLLPRTISAEALAEVLSRFLDTPYPNAQHRLRERAEVYRAETVGKKLKAVYDSCLYRDI